jgi:NitT/TauT family transport system ATP-binding protein
MQKQSKQIFDLDGVTLSFQLASGNRTVLRDVGFSVLDGEILTIVGASGSGKTSLLRIMAGLTPQTAGTATFRGNPINGPQDGVAIVFQDYTNALLQWRTVANNVALGLPKHLRNDERIARIDRTLALVGLDQYVDDYPWQLSGGMQQRVQIARALAVDPSVLLMDEPFAALDAMTKSSLQDQLLRLQHETRASIVFITHDIEEAVYLGNRVAMLRGTPGSIARIFNIDLPFPRDQISTRELPEFLHLRHEIHDAIGEGT